MTHISLESLESRALFAADLAISLTSTTLPDTLTLGAKPKPKTAAIVVSVANIADAADKKNKASVPVTALFRDASNTETLIKTVILKANKFATAKASKVTFKFNPKDLSAGTYTFSVKVDPSAVADTNPANDTLTIKTLTVAAPSTGGGATSAAHPFPGSGLGNTLTFRNDFSLGFSEDGPFNDITGTGFLGRYDILPIAKDNFLLTPDQEIANTIKGTIKVPGKKPGKNVIFGGKTVTFGVAKAGASGSITLSGSKTVIYFTIN